MLILNSIITMAGIDFKIKTIELEGKRIKLQIWSVFTDINYNTRHT